MVTFPHLEKNATFGFQIFVHMFGRKIIFFPTMLSMRQFRPHLQIFAPPPSWLPQPGKHAMAIIQCSSSTQWDNMMSVCTSPRGPTYSGQRGRFLLYEVTNLFDHIFNQKRVNDIRRICPAEALFPNSPLCNSPPAVPQTHCPIDNAVPSILSTVMQGTSVRLKTNDM